MKFSQLFRTAAAFLLTAGTAHAVPLFVTIETLPLVGDLNGPFALNFQLNNGTEPDNNTATLTDFDFGAGGSASGVPDLAGGASGDLSAGVTLTDSDFINSFTQTFVPGASLGFVLSLTTNPDSVFPDQFSFAILYTDMVLGLVEIPTLSFSNVFLTIDIDAGGPIIDASPSDPGQFPFIAMDAPTVEVLAVPEPATFFLLAGALGVFLRGSLAPSVRAARFRER
jgi:hypothetical protein